MMNPQQMSFLQALRNSSNPQQMVYNIVQQSANNNDPFAKNLLEIINSPDPRQKTLDFARNYCRERGVDFDSSFNNFQNTLRTFLGKK